MAPVNRRRALQLVAGGSLAGLAGCVEVFDDEEPEPEPRPEDWCIDEYDEPVPEVYETAESINGIERDPDELRSRHDVGYQCHPMGFQLCANCRYFIPSKTGEPVGACAIVDGGVRSQDWCAVYEHTERLDEPPPLDPLE